MGFHYAAPNLVRICVDQRSAYDISGRMYHCYCRDAFPFQSAGELMMEMDRFFDALDFPQAAVVSRSFHARQIKRLDRNADKCRRVEEMEQYKGDIATFVVHVQYRQNATWQGEVIWTDEQRKSSFRSVLELIKLMDNAMDSAEGRQDADRAEC